MISKQQIKFIKSLSRKKNREEEGIFPAEGTKIVQELLGSTLSIHKIYATRTWMEENSALLNTHPHIQTEVVTNKELEQISEFKTPNEVLALASLPPSSLPKEKDLYLALESIRDPGNMGTLIRLADWFGLEQIICTPDCADAYSHKVVQASMGSIFRIQLSELNLSDFIHTSKLPVYAAALQGSENLHQLTSFSEGILLIGNESQGLSEELLSLSTHKVHIPAYGGAESLNAAMAAGIFLDNFRRLQGEKMKNEK